MNKEQQIKDFLSQPIKVGDKILYNGDDNGSKDKSSYTKGTVMDIDGQKLTIDGYYGKKNPIKRSIDSIKRDTSHIGSNPFKEEIRNTQFQIGIDGLIGRFYDKDLLIRKEKVKDFYVPELSFDYFVNGVNIQRELVWDLESKQSLINSIYNRIDIGKFVFKTHNIGFFYCIDGKQRLNTIVEFIRNEFKDIHGNNFSDLSKKAQRTFMNYRNMFYCELPESTNDQDIIDTFLALNHTGVNN